MNKEHINQSTKSVNFATINRIHLGILIIYFVILVGSYFSDRISDPRFRRTEFEAQIIMDVMLGIVFVAIILGVINLKKEFIWYKNVAFFAMIIVSFGYCSIAMFDLGPLMIIPTIIAIFYFDYKLVLVVNFSSVIAHEAGIYVYKKLYFFIDYNFNGELYNLYFNELVYMFLLILLGLVAARLSLWARKSIEQVVEQQAVQAAMDQDVKVAAAIQNSMLDVNFPKKKEYEIYASMKPAKDVGGDFYDYFKVNNKTVALIIADVSGKGIQAALFMGLTKALIKVYSLIEKSTDKIAEKTNLFISPQKGANMFVTAWIGLLDIETGKLYFTNAGHNPPCIIHGGNKYEFLRAKSDFVIGGRKQIRYSENQINLEPGDKLFLYTDGVTEAKNSNEEFYTSNRLLEELNRDTSRTPCELINDISESLSEFRGEAEQYDDITMLAFAFDAYLSIEDEIFATFPAKREHFDEAINYIKTQLNAFEINQRVCQEIEIAASEILANICSYAYNNQDGDVEICVKYNMERIVLIFRDKGVQFDPIDVDKPDTTLSLRERSRGGMGIHIVKKLMTDVNYKYDNGKNVLTMVKVI